MVTGARYEPASPGVVSMEEVQLWMNGRTRKARCADGADHRVRPRAPSLPVLGRSFPVLVKEGRMDEPIDEWAALPMMLTVKDAALVLRIGRSKA